MVETPVSQCAKNKKRYTLEYPAKMLGWSAFSDEAVSLLADRLVTCEQNGKLPADGATIEKMKLCVIGDDCGEIDGFFATNPSGLQKIKDRLHWCGERP
jgi:hypothetical protein